MEPTRESYTRGIRDAMEIRRAVVPVWAPHRSIREVALQAIGEASTQAEIDTVVTDIRRMGKDRRTLLLVRRAAERREQQLRVEAIIR